LPQAIPSNVTYTTVGEKTSHIQTAHPAWHSLDVPTVVHELETSERRGLTAEQARARLSEHGHNELLQEAGISALRLLINQFKNTLIIILLIAIGLSFLVGEVLDASLILVIVIFCAILGFVQEYRAERALEALRKMLSPTITVLRDDQEREIPSKELVPGDILILEAGDRIPADARLVEAYAVKCDEASLTGESMAVGKNTAVVAEDARLPDRSNMFYTGTVVAYGRAKAVVVATGMTTELGKIAREVTSLRSEESPLEKRTREIGRWLGMMAFVICFLVVAISVIRQGFVGQVDGHFLITMVTFAVALAVAAVPEALTAIVTGALAVGVHQMAQRHALIRKMPAVETLGCTTVICTDKTGTLTKGEMTVRKIFAGGRIIDVSGAGYVPEGRLIDVAGQPVQLDETVHGLLQAGVLCNDAQLLNANGDWSIKGDPTEAALLVAAVKGGLDVDAERLAFPRREEFPFSSERKRMTTIHGMAQGGLMLFCKGAPEVILERCTQLLVGTEQRDLDDAMRRDLQSVNEQMAKEALRVLAVARRELPLGGMSAAEEMECEMVFLGMMGMMDPPREEVRAAIDVCRQVRIKPVMITGDHALTAVAVARELGIFNDGDRVLTGDELENLPLQELTRMVHLVTVYARVSPLDKLKIVRAWKARGEVVAMTGDGVNDAPALKQADIGIAMGITGTDVAKEAADMILNDDNFATIVKAVELGRWIYDNIKKYLTYLLRCNLTEVAVIGGVVLTLGPDHLPLLPAAILYINLATDGLPALALGIAPPDPDVMQRPPRDPKESVFSWEVNAFILLALLIEVPFFFYLFFHTKADIDRARSFTFVLFIVVELIIALNFRSMRYSVFSAPPHSWLVLAVLSQAILTVGLLQIPTVRDTFGISLPPLLDLAVVGGFGIVVFISIEVLKVIFRARTTR
jgi:P-type Ca2+ transporter type 2C